MCIHGESYHPTRLLIRENTAIFSSHVPVPVYSLSVPCRRDTHSYYSKAGPAWSSATNAIRGGAAGSHGSGPYLTGPTAPDPLPSWGRVRRRHVSLRKGSSELTAEAWGSETSHVHPDLPRSRTNIPPGGPEPPRVPQARAQARARVFQEDSPTHRIQCGWLRCALPPWHTGQLLSDLTVDRILSTYTVQPHAPHPRRARLPH